MRFLTILSLLIVFSSFGQEELNSTPLYKSLYEANKEPNKVIRLSPVDFNPSKDGFALTKFKNLQALDLSYCEKVNIVPLGFKKLSQLKYLNISFTDIEFIYPYIKKLANLKTLVAVKTKVSQKELTKITKKLGIKVITNLEQAPYIFSLESFDPKLANTSQQTTSQTSSNTTVQSITNTKHNSTSPTSNSTNNNTNSTPTNNSSSITTNNNPEENTSNKQNSSYKVYSIKEVNESNAKYVRNVFVSAFGGDLERLVEFIPQLTSLERLRMGAVFSNFPSIPKEINKLKKLKYLEIVTGDEIEIPALSLPELDTLILPPTKNIPEWIKNNHLKSLTLYTHLNKIDWSKIPTEELEQMSIICDYSSYESGSSVGAPNIEGVGVCTNLKSFKIEMTRPEKRSIKVEHFTLPSEIGKLSNLQKLIIKNLKISNDVDAVGSLTSLEELYIRPKKIPDSFKNLINLKSFQNMHWHGDGIYNLATTGINEVLPYWHKLEKLLICPSEGTVNLSKNKSIKKVFVDCSQSFERTEIILPENNKLEEVSVKFSKAGVNKWKLNSNSVIDLSLFCEGEKNTLPIDLMNCKTVLKKLSIYKSLDTISFTKEDFPNITSYIVK